MDFLNWYVPRGRITRRVFWLHYVLPFFLLSALALAVDVSFGYTSLDVATADSQAALAIEYGPFVTGVGLLTVVPSIASQVTRLHDQGRSAWWLLLNVLPVFGQLALLGICGIVPGQPGPNRYGPPVDGTAGPDGQPWGAQSWGAQSWGAHPGPQSPGAQSGWGAPPQASQPGSWTPGPQDRAPDYPPSDWR